MKKNASKAKIAKEPPKEVVEEKPKVVEEEISGYGRFQYRNGTIYIGNWKQVNGVKNKHGFGKIIHAGTTTAEFGTEEYEGDWVDDLMHGHGVYKYTSGAVYRGSWKKGKHDGYGIYQMPDGSNYQGMWSDHKMNGEGKYTESNGKIWEGIFVDGLFETKNQKKLLGEKELAQKLKKLEEDCKLFFEKFFEVFAKSDKKTFKDNLTPFFGTVDIMKEFLVEPYTKYEERPPEKWNEAFHWVFDDKAFSVKAICKKSESKLIEPDRIRWDHVNELEFGGQIVEIEKKVNEREILMTLLQKNDKSWAVVFFKENITKPGK